jgi:uncharacterized protein YjbJ (UPF0337 family)
MNKPNGENTITNGAAEAVAAMGAFADEAKTQADDLANRASAAVGQTYGQARDQVRGAAAARTVEQQPGIALLAVGLFCGALGFLLARR